MELKVQNERLQQKVAELRSKSLKQAVPNPTSSSPSSGPIYATSSIPPRPLQPPVVPSKGPPESSSSFYTTSGLAQGGFGDVFSGTTRSTFEGDMYGGGPTYGSSLAPPGAEDDNLDEISKRKKVS